MTFHLASDIGEVLEAALVDGGRPERGRGPATPRRGPAGRGLTVSRRRKKLGEDAGQLHGLIALDAVPGAADPDHLVGGSAAAELGLVGIVDHRGEVAPDQQHRHPDALEVVPHRAEVEGVHVEAGRPRGPAQLVAPGPGPVLALHCVVEHAAAQGRLRPGGVELDGPLEDLVEGGEGLRAGQKGGDVRALVVIDPGGDVDQGQALAPTRGAGWPGRSRSCRRATSPPPIGRRGPARRWRWPRRRPSPPGRGPGRRPGQSEWPCPGRSTATSGRPRARATVSQVWAFWPPPWRNTISGGGGTPHQRAHPTTVGHLDRLAAHHGRAVPGQAGLGGVVLEEGELVVVAAGRRAHAAAPPGARPNSSTSSASVPSAIGYGV